MVFQHSGQASKEVTVIRSMAPINLIVYYPKTEEGQIELAKRVRCPRSRSNPANQIAELPYKPEAGAFGCGHRNRKRKKQGTDLMESLLPPASYYFPSNLFAVASTDSKKACSTGVRSPQ